MKVGRIGVTAEIINVFIGRVVVSGKSDYMSAIGQLFRAKLSSNWTATKLPHKSQVQLSNLPLRKIDSKNAISKKEGTKKKNDGKPSVKLK